MKEFSIPLLTEQDIGQTLRMPENLLMLRDM